MTDEEAVRTVTELYENERKEERKMKEKELNEKAEALNEGIAALEEHITAFAEEVNKTFEEGFESLIAESKRIADKMDAVMDAYGEKGEIPRSVMAQAIMVNSIDYELRHTADEVARSKHNAFRLAGLEEKDEN